MILHKRHTRYEVYLFILFILFLFLFFFSTLSADRILRSCARGHACNALFVMRSKPSQFLNNFNSTKNLGLECNRN